MLRCIAVPGLLVCLAGLAGCSVGTAPAVTSGTSVPEAQADGEGSEVRAERAKLSAEDRALVEAQEWCVVSNEERLGSMGPPVKLMINNQPVFLCCKGCKRRAEANPEKTLAKLEQLKDKKKAESGK
jgi:hypothetical protein